MTNKQQNNNKKLPPTTGSDPTPRLNLPNKEKGIRNLYLNKDEK